MNQPIGSTTNFEPAFPITKDMVIEGQSVEATQGMTLRDYLAAKAMQSLLIDRPHTSFKLIAEESYQCADAMLTQRQGERDE